MSPIEPIEEYVKTFSGSPEELSKCMAKFAVGKRKDLPGDLALLNEEGWRMLQALMAFQLHAVRSKQQWRLIRHAAEVMWDAVEKDLDLLEVFDRSQRPKKTKDDLTEAESNAVNEGRRLMDFVTKRLGEAGQFMPMFEFLLENGNVEIVAVDGNFMENAESKNKLAKIARKRIAQGDVAACLFTSDMWFGKPSNDHEFQRMREAQRSGLNVREIGDMGIAAVGEAAMVSIECRSGYRHVIAQEYMRNGETEVMFADRREEYDAHASGRFFGLFETRHG